MYLRKTKDNSVYKQKRSMITGYAALIILIVLALSGYIHRQNGQQEPFFSPFIEKTSCEAPKEEEKPKVSVRIKGIVTVAKAHEGEGTCELNTRFPLTDRQTAVKVLIENTFRKDKCQAVRMAYCESGLGSNMVNGVSTAEGIFQFIDGTWRSERKAMGRDTDLAYKFDDVQNVETAWSHYRKNGWGPWWPSINCMNNL